MAGRIKFIVQLTDTEALGADGSPVPLADAFEFTFRRPRIIDEQNISRRIRELAAQLKADGVPDPSVYADMLAHQELLLRGFRDTLASILFPPDPADEVTVLSADEKKSRAQIISACFDMLPRLIGTRKAVPQDEAEATALSMLVQLPTSDLRELYGQYIEVMAVSDAVASLETVAKWEVLSDMPASHAQMDECPGWHQWRDYIVSAWNTAWEEEARGFKKPSGG